MSKIKLLLVCLLGIVLALTISFKITYGTHPPEGWLWSGSTNGVGNGNIGWIHANSPASPPLYGIIIPANDGDLDGYLYSQNAGWIHMRPNPDFSVTTGYPGCGYPTAPCSSQGIGVRRVGDDLVGWALFTSIKTALEDTSVIPGGNSGGWRGFIKFTPRSAAFSPPNSYGPESAHIELAAGLPGGFDNRIVGYAWSGGTTGSQPGEFGYIKFGPGTNPLAGGYPRLLLHLGSTPPPAPPPPAGPPPPPPPAGPPPPPPLAITVNCSGRPNPGYLSSGGIITFGARNQANQLWGPPASVNWNLIDAGQNINSLTSNPLAIRYSSTGLKRVQVTVTSGALPPGSAVCQAEMKTSRLKEILTPFF